MECTSPFLYLADSIRNQDHRQDAYLALIERQPESEDDAKAILVTLEHSKRNEARKRPMQLSVEPCSDALEPSGIHAAIARLPPEESYLIQLRYISGLTIREIAAKENRSVGATHEALTLALDKLKAILSK